MVDPVIQEFFSDRKEAWLKKKVSATMEALEITNLQQECDQLFSLDVWLPNAAKRAGQISIATHPCTFSHPSARKNNNGYVTSVIANIEKKNDGFIKSGCVEVDKDALGNAAALDVYKFLTLILKDGLSLLDHILQDSEQAENLLNINSSTYQELKSGFSAMIESDGENVTSSKIKQVYFPVDTDYHQLSLLTNSGMVFYLRKKLDSLRFSEEIKTLRDLKRKNLFSEKGYSEIYDLTTIGYGGTKPQNISVLNNQNGGKAHLLLSLPPSIEKRNIRFPKQDFFTEAIRKNEFSVTFKKLHKLFIADSNNIKIRNARDFHIRSIFNAIIEKMWAVRAVSLEQYYEKTSVLNKNQLTWLLDERAQERQESIQWLDAICSEIVRWIVQSYEKSQSNQAIKFGEEEYKLVINIIEENKEFLR